MTYILLLSSLGVLVILNGMFVAAEFALVRARKSRLEVLASEKKRGAATALQQFEHMSEYLSACQVGITMASLGIGFLGEPAIASLLESVIGDSIPHVVSLTLSFATAYLLTTALHITIGEQVPKMYAIVHAERIICLLSGFLKWFNILLRPLVWVLNNISNALLRLLGVDAQLVHEEASTSEDLKLIIAQSATGGTLDLGEATMLSGVFHLHEQQARQVMTPIPSVVTVDLTESVETALRRCIDSGHTRLVVIEDNNTDHVRGTVHNNSLAHTLLEEGPMASIRSLVRQVPIVPETRPLDDLLADLQRERASMAIILDEYGRTVGVVSVEDIIEETVGEIADETDAAMAPIRQLASGDWFAHGEAPITDLADYGVELPVDNKAFNSIGGFIFATLGRLPKRGDTVFSSGYRLRVESVRENRIAAVRIRKWNEDESAGEIPS